jgi:hypothetical protein
MIWIDGNVPSSKNSKVKSKNGVFSSSTVKRYLSALGIQKYSVRRKEVTGYKTKPNVFENLRPEFEKALEGKESPVWVGFHFVRDSKRKFDFHNIVQIVADLMVAHDFIGDDDMDHFIPVPFKIKGQLYTVDKEKPGVYIKIFKNGKRDFGA